MAARASGASPCSSRAGKAGERVGHPAGDEGAHVRRLVRANVHSAALVGGEDPQGAAGAVDRLILGAVPALRSGHGQSALGAGSLVGGIIGQLGRPHLDCGELLGLAAGGALGASVAAARFRQNQQRN